MRVKDLLTSSLLMVTLILGCSKSDKDDTVVTPVHWDYENTDWQEEGYSECAGKAESPIDINTSQTIKGQLPAITFNYQDMPLQVLDNGHTIQVLGDGKNSIVLNGKTFVLKQLHFHHLSEHKIDGKAQAMEIHFVNQHDASGEIVVLAVFLTPGKQNTILDKVFNNFPTTKDTPKLVANVTLNPADLLPKNRSYYNYTGSLTTPPCTQGLDWIVYKNAVEFSSDQETTFSKLYPKNSRPTQDLANRIVLEQDEL